jgi:hypothetical protein
MRERNLAWSHRLAAADEAGVADGVVGAAEGAMLDEPAVGREQSRNAVNLGHHQGLGEIERREQRRQTARQHGLAAARCADQKQVVSSRRGDLECAARAVLPSYVGQVEARHRQTRERRRRRDIEPSLARQVLLEGRKVVGEPGFDAAREPRLAPIVARHHGASKTERVRADAPRRRREWADRPARESHPGTHPP